MTARKTIFVTGGGHGIGRAVCLRLAEEGGAVAVSDIDEAAARQVADTIVAAGGTAIATTCDVTSRASVDGSIAAAAAHFGRLDILVTTAGAGFGREARLSFQRTGG